MSLSLVSCCFLSLSLFPPSLFFFALHFLSHSSLSTLLPVYFSLASAMSCLHCLHLSWLISLLTYIVLLSFLPYGCTLGFSSFSLFFAPCATSEAASLSTSIESLFPLCCSRRFLPFLCPSQPPPSLLYLSQSSHRDRVVRHASQFPGLCYSRARDADVRFHGRHASEEDAVGSSSDCQCEGKDSNRPQQRRR